MSPEPEPLPLPLRAWALTRHAPRFRGRARVAVSAAPKLLDGERPYRGADGLVLRVDPEDEFQALMLLGLYDREAVGALRAHAGPDNVVVDAGAHIGYFSLHAARCVGASGEVHAFEPDPRLAPRLREHAELNGAAQITANEAALSDRDGVLQLTLSGQLAWSSLHHEGGADSEQVAVRAHALDDYLAERGVDRSRIAFIKIDVEGAEPAALRGMARTLESSRAAVLVEIDPARASAIGDEPAAPFELLEAAGYRAERALSLRGSGAKTIEALRGGETEAAADVLFLPVAG